MSKFQVQVHDPATVIFVDDLEILKPEPTGGYIQIDDKLMEVLPFNSQEGVLYTFIDEGHMKSAQVRLKRNG